MKVVVLGVAGGFGEGREEGRGVIGRGVWDWRGVCGLRPMPARLRERERGRESIVKWNNEWCPVCRFLCEK